MVEHGGLVNLGDDIPTADQRLDLACKGKSMRLFRKIKRFYPHWVTRQCHAAFVAVPECHRKNPVQPRKTGRAFAHKKAQENLGIAMPNKLFAGRLKLCPQFAIIVDLTIVDHDPTAIGRVHRLVSGNRQVDDRQPRMTQPDVSRGVVPMTQLIRPPPPHRGQPLIRRAGGPLYSIDPAHRFNASSEMHRNI